MTEAFRKFPESSGLLPDVLPGQCNNMDPWERRAPCVRSPPQLLARTRSEKDGRAKDGTEKQNRDGNSPPGKTAARAHTIRGKNLSLKESGERSLRRWTQCNVKEETITWNRS